jgi:hypothetical protein
MESQRPPNLSGSIAALRRIARQKPPVERCELCNVELGPGHRHLIEPESRKLVCSCDPCAILFAHADSSKYRRVPRRVRRLSGFRMTDAQWDALRVPIDMAYFFFSTTAGRVVAFYPSPAGSTESLLPLESWDEIVRDNPVLADLEPDVEALLVNRVGIAREQSIGEFFTVPVDECYRLTGIIRARWRGLSGGTEVWSDIGRFFSDLRSRATVVGEVARA